MSDLRSLLMDEVQEGSCLNSIFEIEDLLLMINDMNRKVEFYKELRRRRVQSIDAKVKLISQKEGVLRQVILNTMKKLSPEDKTVNFPSVGKISRRSLKDSWQVDDENAVLAYLEEKGDKPQVIVESVDKRKLKTLLDQYKKSKISVPGVSVKVGGESLSVTFDKNESSSLSQTPPDVSLDELDSLEI